MNTKAVSQLDDDGFFVGIATAFESPLEPNVFHLPKNCVDVPPPDMQSWQKAKYVAGSWIIEEPQEEEVAPEEEQVEESYKEKRLKEYPPFSEYLDGVSKGDAAQIQRYIDACLEVKAKYPKPF
jgi:hypothetical protein